MFFLNDSYKNTQFELNIEIFANLSLSQNHRCTACSETLPTRCYCQCCTHIVSLISTAIDMAAAAAAPSVDDTGNSVDNAVDTDSTVCMLDDTILTADNFSDGV